jgi:hypothetical protein
MDPGRVPANCYYYRYRKGHERLYSLDPVAGMVVESRRHDAAETAFSFPVLRCSPYEGFLTKW